MSPWLREAVVTVATSVFVAGPLAAIALVAMPPSWRSPLVLWGILITVLLVVGRRRRRRPQRPPP
jgi:membrane protein implicated in regulation of membrane protease activity